MDLEWAVVVGARSDYVETFQRNADTWWPSSSMSLRLRRRLILKACEYSSTVHPCSMNTQSFCEPLHEGWLDLLQTMLFSLTHAITSAPVKPSRWNAVETLPSFSAGAQRAAPLAYHHCAVSSNSTAGREPLRLLPASPKNLSFRSLPYLLGIVPEKKPPLMSSVLSSVALPRSSGSGPTKLFPDALKWASEPQEPRPAGNRPAKPLSLTSNSRSIGIDTNAVGSTPANALPRSKTELSAVRPRTASGMVPLRFMPARSRPVTAPRSSQRTPFQPQCGAEPPAPELPQWVDERRPDGQQHRRLVARGGRRIGRPGAAHERQ
ncbi:hypothetical protein TRIUR3_16115 [Triticum urartu]|uniref:Uncharacterized protein n=1 Tax=Triticum urartu TaxID=4572 RepID=M7YZN5_TRIUA|nr:hypothetical protein TRIUR3_16115 [Triticum urartu]